MTLELSSQDQEILQRIVRQYYMNLRHEIRKTDSSFFKQSLKEEEALVENLLAKLSAEAVAP
jgi:hypothetical protein